MRSGGLRKEGRNNRQTLPEPLVLITWKIFEISHFTVNSVVKYYSEVIVNAERL